MTVEQDLPDVSQASESGVVERLARSRLGGVLALSATLAALGVANLSRPASSHATEPVRLALAVGHGKVTFENNGSTCLRAEVEVSSIQSVGGGTNTAVDPTLSGPVRPGREIRRSFNARDKGMAASLNVYRCSDAGQSKPLTPPDIFRFQQGYSVNMTGGQRPRARVADESVAGASAIPPDSVFCIVPPVFLGEDLGQASLSLSAGTGCQSASQYRPESTSAQRIRRLKHIVGGFVMATSGSAPHGSKPATILRIMPPGQTLTLDSELYGLDQLKRIHEPIPE